MYRKKKRQENKKNRSGEITKREKNFEKSESKLTKK